MRKGILIGIGILIILLALAGTGSANPSGSLGSNCPGCHPSISSENATFYDQTHRYNATSIAYNVTANNTLYCDKCHVDVSTHGMAEVMNFSLRNGTATYLTSSVCEDCHKAKYDNWYNTTHRTKLVNKSISQAAGFPIPPGYNWTNITYTIGGKWKVRFMNETGYVITGTQAQYNVQDKAWVAYNNGTVTPYDCGGCHTTGYNASAPSRFGLTGIVGNWTEDGIGCEACHGGAGTGHQVVVNKSAELCGNCHTRNAPNQSDIDPQRRHRSQFADWLHSGHAPPSTAYVTDSYESCKKCHSPLDYAENKSVISTTAGGIGCIVCHNTHNISDPMYANITKLGAYGYNASDNSSNFSDVKPAKVEFYNASQNKNLTVKNVYDVLTTPTLIYDYDTNYPGPINVTGPISEVLCSKCHYNHGIAHISQVNLTHARNNYPSLGKQPATCTDCHMPKSRKSATAWDIRSHTMTLDDLINYTTAPTKNYPELTCSRGTECHVTSDQNLSSSNSSVVPIQREWNATAHNDKEISINKSSNSSFYLNGTTGAVKSRQNSCLKCHSPFDWNPATDSNTTNVQLSSDFKGIVCSVCHNIHDMGDWINETGKVYAWYNRDAINNSGVYQANYTVMDNTTELCGNCHSNIRIGNTGPGWASSASTTPIKPHGYPAKDVFVGSWKQTSNLNFECIDCHMYRNKTNATGSLLNDSEKITGHSFAVNESGLQNTTRCSGCHDGTNYGTIASVIDQIQADTQAKWNTTNSIVLGALAAYNAYPGVKNVSADKIAQAYWNLQLVDSDESWGVHDPVEANLLLDNAVTLAESSNASLGQALVSTVNLTAGWNLKALQNASAVTSPVSVMSSVASNITVVWGYNTSNPSDPWELYDPAMPTSLNDLTEIVSGEGYWIYAIRDCVWTV